MMRTSDVLLEKRYEKTEISKEGEGKRGFCCATASGALGSIWFIRLMAFCHPIKNHAFITVRQQLTM